MISGTQATNTIRLAKVTACHPEGQKLEVMFLDTGDYGRDVQVMSPYAGTDFGFTSGIPSPEAEGHAPNKSTNPGQRHLIAVVATLQGRHVCLGFLFPQVTHMAFRKGQDKNRMIERSPSDHYRTINDEAEFEQYHPSDAWVRIAEDMDHEDLSGRDYDAQWQLKRNLDKNPIITLWNRFKESKEKWSRIFIKKDRIKIQVTDEGDDGSEDDDTGAIIELKPESISLDAGEITLNAGIIRINGEIFHTGNNIQLGVHTDSNGLHIGLEGVAGGTGGGGGQEEDGQGWGGDTAPAASADGPALWFNGATGKLYSRYTANGVSQWVQV